MKNFIVFSSKDAENFDKKLEFETLTDQDVIKSMRLVTNGVSMMLKIDQKKLQSIKIMIAPAVTAKKLVIRKGKVKQLYYRNGFNFSAANEMKKILQ